LHAANEMNAESPPVSTTSSLRARHGIFQEDQGTL